MADVAATLADWSSTTASNSPSGVTSVGTGLDDNLREIQGVVVRGLSHKGSDIASATTTDIGAVEGLMHDITGTTTIAGLGTVRAGIIKVLKFEGALTLTHNATSLILPGGANITTADGDVAMFISEGSGNWRCVAYTGRASAAEVVAGTEATKAITPAAFAGSKDISGAEGYYKLPGGVIIQWGSVTTNASGDATWTYPTAFSSAVFTVQGTSHNGDAALTVSMETPTTSDVGVRTRNHADSQVSVTVSMFAVGV
jgi:hypothetical protein